MKNNSLKIILKESIVLEYVFTSALILFFFSDAANKYLIYRNAELKSISIFTRAVYELIFMGIILFYVNRARMSFLILFIVWAPIFIIGQFIYSKQVDFSYDFGENISRFNKYLFVFIAYYAAYRFEHFTESFRKLLRVMEKLFVINSVFIICGWLFNIILFATYLTNHRYTYRWGFSGIVPAQNEATMFIMLIVSYFYHKHFILKEKSWEFYCAFISSFFIGTKGVYIFLIFLSVFHFFYHSTPFQRRIIFFVALLTVAGFFWFLQTSYAHILLEYYFRNYREHGFLQMMLSGRNTFFAFKFWGTVAYWTPLNFFIGGQDQTVLLMEMDFFDAFLYFGIIGSVILFVLYFKTLFRFNLFKPFNLFFTFCFFLIAFLAGHFFSSALNGLYLALVCLYFYIADKNPLLFSKNTAG